MSPRAALTIMVRGGKGIGQRCCLFCAYNCACKIFIFRPCCLCGAGDGAAAKQDFLQGSILQYCEARASVALQIDRSEGFAAVPHNR